MGLGGVGRSGDGCDHPAFLCKGLRRVGAAVTTELVSFAKYIPSSSLEKKSRHFLSSMSVSVTSNEMLGAF